MAEKSVYEPDHLKSLVSRYVRAILDWMDVPKEIIQAGKLEGRPLIRRMVAESWAKLAPDLLGALCLIDNNNIGPAMAMTRICRENALRMITWAFGEAVDDVVHAHIFIDQKPQANARRLQRQRVELLREWGEHLDGSLRARWKREEEMLDRMVNKKDDHSCEVPVRIRDAKSIFSTANLSMERLRAKDIDLNNIALQVEAYWFECEAVHSGHNAVCLYAPDTYDLSREAAMELTRLDRLRSLNGITPMVNVAVLEAFDVRGQLRKPETSRKLACIANQVERVILDAPSA